MKKSDVDKLLEEKESECSKKMWVSAQNSVKRVAEEVEKNRRLNNELRDLKVFFADKIKESGDEANKLINQLEFCVIDNTILRSKIFAFLNKLAVLLRKAYLFIVK